MPPGNRVYEILEADRVERFDLGKPAPFRMLLLHIGVDEHVLALTNHHIILADGWSRCRCSCASVDPLRGGERDDTALRNATVQGLPSLATGAWRRVGSCVEQVLQGLSEPTLLVPAQASICGGLVCPTRSTSNSATS